MKINIYRSNVNYPHVLYGDVIRDDHKTGDTFDRFYIYADGDVEICERVESTDGSSSSESAVRDSLHTSFQKNVIEHGLLRFFGNIEFYWESGITEYLAMDILDGISESLEVDNA